MFSVYKSNVEMDVKNYENSDRSKRQCIRSDFKTLKSLDISWRVMFYPSGYTNDAEVRFIIENRTVEKYKYKFQLNCEGGILIDWDSEFSNLEKNFLYYDSTMSATRYIEESYTVHKQLCCGPNYTNFKLNAGIAVKKTNNSNGLNLSSDSFIIYPSEDDNDQFDTSTIIDEEISPSSVRSPAFMACISKIFAETKDDSLPDLVILASKLLEVAKKFNLPDLEKVSSGFLDFQISDNNFADILEIAVDQKIAALLNSATEYITNNQNDLRETDQWIKMKACPVMLLSILEKLFEKNV